MTGEEVSTGEQEFIKDSSQHSTVACTSSPPGPSPENQFTEESYHYTRERSTRTKAQVSFTESPSSDTKDEFDAKYDSGDAEYGGVPKPRTRKRTRQPKPQPGSTKQAKVDIEADELGSGEPPNKKTRRHNGPAVKQNVLSSYERHRNPKILKSNALMAIQDLFDGHESIISGLKEDISKLEGELAQRRELEEEHEVLQGVLSKLEEENSQHEQQKAALKKEMDKDNARLREENMKLKAECQKYRVRIVEILQEQKTDVARMKVSDDAITARWNSLTFQIQNLVLLSLTTPADEGTHTADSSPPGFNAEYMAKITELCKRNRPLQPFYLHRFIWDGILKMLLHRWYQPWAGRIGNSLASLSAALSNCNHADTLAELSPHKAQMAQIIHERASINVTELDNIAQALWSDLAHFSSAEQKQTFMERMRSILKKALDVHILMLSSRAFFRIMDFQEASLFEIIPPLNTDVMHVYFQFPCHEDRIMREVVCCISPLVQKVGNADGENFEATTILCKAKVVVHYEDVESEGVKSEAVKLEAVTSEAVTSEAVKSETVKSEADELVDG
ncbi:hypothetical protein B0I35DRAFT_473944 [Stachybotrys elegans]|uniref:Uncharacterized protein n=1 Tax=Stachybotrys elegans TaxID=80388 RepID=A0A8K0T2M5_9HYPO|nr:hypothetical protein B0I35DRAFT_473944 [Stachybotrys elegans]